MRQSTIRVFTILAFAFAAPALIADDSTRRDVYVEGYHKKDGTYVPPHYRSPPDDSRANNYGQARKKENRQPLNLRMRDYDGDGIPNHLDDDDDNDGMKDDEDIP